MLCLYRYGDVGCPVTVKWPVQSDQAQVYRAYWLGTNQLKHGKFAAAHAKKRLSTTGC